MHIGYLEGWMRMHFRIYSCDINWCHGFENQFGSIRFLGNRHRGCRFSSLRVRQLSNNHPPVRLLHVRYVCAFPRWTVRVCWVPIPTFFVLLKLLRLRVPVLCPLWIWIWDWYRNICQGIWPHVVSNWKLCLFWVISSAGMMIQLPGELCTGPVDSWLFLAIDWRVSSCLSSIEHDKRWSNGSCGCELSELLWESCGCGPWFAEEPGL